jgi:hypothetical protein
MSISSAENGCQVLYQVIITLSDLAPNLRAAMGIGGRAYVQGGMRRTALHWACQRGDVRSVEALVSAGADTKVIPGAKCAKRATGSMHAR